MRRFPHTLQIINAPTNLAYEELQKIELEPEALTGTDFAQRITYCYGINRMSIRSPRVWFCELSLTSAYCMSPCRSPRRWCRACNSAIRPEEIEDIQSVFRRFSRSLLQLNRIRLTYTTERLKSQWWSFALMRRLECYVLH